MALTQVDQGLLGTNAQYTGFKNRIINGGMTIAQRGTSAVNTNVSYPVDRFRLSCSVNSKVSLQQSSTVPTGAGFVNSIIATSSSAYTVGASETFEVDQQIEGYNTADLMWGSASAKPVTLSFWVRSSLTGTFGGTFENSGNTRAYPFSYTISAADTWEQKTITVAGDTSGTWLTDNSRGIIIRWSLGCGSNYLNTANTWASGDYQSVTGETKLVATNAATWYITGVQLEKGSTATSFDYRPYGTELSLCQRYCYVLKGDGNILGTGYNRATTRCDVYTTFPVTMRAAPTGSVTSGTNYYYVDYSQATTYMNSFTVNFTTPQNAFLLNTGLSGLTAASGNSLWTNNASAYVAFSAEL